jgi:hypothetical protein
MKEVNLKAEMLKVLGELTRKGWTRTTIERKLNYSDNYIDQQLSKGGNKRVLHALNELNAEPLQKAIETAKVTEQEPSIDHESRRTLERTLENLSEDKIRSTAIIERLVTMLEKQISSGVLSKSHQEAPLGPENNVVSPGFARVTPSGRGEKEKPKSKH